MDRLGCSAAPRAAGPVSFSKLNPKFLTLTPHGDAMDDLLDSGAPEIFFDGIHEIKVTEGVVRLALYSNQTGSKVICARLAIPFSGLPDIILILVTTMAEATKEIVKPPTGH